MSVRTVAAPARPVLPPEPEVSPRAATTSRIAFGGATALFAVAVGALVVAAMTGALGYDEAYNLQVPQHVVADGRYATDGAIWDGTVRAYDSYISTGPTVLLPVAALFGLLGSHVAVARLVPLAYFFLCLAMTWRVSRALVLDGGGKGVRRQASWAALLASAVVLAIDGERWRLGDGLTAGSVLGEYAAAVFLLIAAIRMPRRTGEAGIWFGLALLSKFLILLALPAYVVAAALAGVMTSRAAAGRRAAGRFLIGAVAPVAVWQAVKLLSLGPHTFWLRTLELVDFVGTGGSGLDGGGSGLGLADRWHLALSAWHVPAFLSVCLVMCGVGYVYRASRSELRGLTAPGASCVISVALGGAAAAQIAWWFFLADRAYPRHLFVGLVLGTPLLLTWAWRLLMLSSAPRSVRRLLTATLAGCLLVSTLLTVLAELHPPRGTASLAAERSVATELREHHARYVGFSGAWSQNPEITFLSGLPAHDLDSDGRRDGGRGGYLVVSPLEQWLNRDAARRALGLCAPASTTRISGYAVCRVASAGSSRPSR